MNNVEETFRVDGQLLMVLPRAGASLRNPDVRMPMLRADEDGYYMCFVEVDNEDLMKKVFMLLDDVSRLTEIEEWTLDFFHGTETTVTTDKINEWLKKT